eukprot:CAMPEP_0184696516 /NCGR_PEP_ID=MMETSP0313-20130426/3776_1 /TAXON_ID=2792 /ORGANISM="Porphyridium aerugineum, Strain SAG 1380-2" /LENGTH=276 /DNA_ID=CAMNT_0027155147 /DNA_START=146 /DNA_END=976 /DNA_ORIENTATION=+
MHEDHLLDVLEPGGGSLPIHQTQSYPQTHPPSTISDTIHAHASSLPPLKALLLDVDGTLCETDSVHYTVYRDMLASLGFFEDSKPISRAFFDKHISGGANELILTNLFPQWTQQQRNAFAEEKEIRWRQAVKGSLRPIQGLISFTEYAQTKNLKRCAVTNAPKLNVDCILSEIELIQWFTTENICLAENCPRAKPFPDPYLIGAAKLQVNPQECLAVEDSVSGLKAAVEAKVSTVIGITTSASEQTLRNAGAHFVINNWQDELVYQICEARLRAKE